MQPYTYTSTHTSAHTHTHIRTYTRTNTHTYTQSSVFCPICNNASGQNYSYAQNVLSLSRANSSQTRTTACFSSESPFCTLSRRTRSNTRIQLEQCVDFRFW